MAILKLSFLYQRLELTCQYLDMTQILGNRVEFLRADFQLLESHGRIRWFQLKSLSWQSCSKNWNSITSRFRNPRTLLPIFPQQVLFLLQCLDVACILIFMFSVGRPDNAVVIGYMCAMAEISSNSLIYKKC